MSSVDYKRKVFGVYRESEEVQRLKVSVMQAIPGSVQARE